MVNKWQLKADYYFFFVDYQPQIYCSKCVVNNYTLTEIKMQFCQKKKKKLGFVPKLPQFSNCIFYCSSFSVHFYLGHKQTTFHSKFSGHCNPLNAETASIFFILRINSIVTFLEINEPILIEAIYNIRYTRIN